MTCSPLPRPRKDRVQQGHRVVAMTPPKVGMTPVTELQFRWLDAPKTQPPYINPCRRRYPNTAKWLPDRSTGDARAYRPVGSACADQWKGGCPALELPRAVPLFLTQPTQSRKKKASPVQQTAPLPSTAVTPPSPVPQTSPLPPSSVTQAPAASSTTQMRRSSSMVMPRGVEGDEGTTTETRHPLNRNRNTRETKETGCQRRGPC